MEVDLPHEPAAHRDDYAVCYLSHAVEESRRGLEEVSSSMLTLQSRLTRHRKLKAIDFLGAVLALAGTVLLVTALEWAGTEYPWTSPAVLATLLVGVSVYVGFVLWQWKGPIFALVPRKYSSSLVTDMFPLTLRQSTSSRLVLSMVLA